MVSNFATLQWRHDRQASCALPRLETLSAFTFQLAGGPGSIVSESSNPIDSGYSRGTFRDKPGTNQGPDFLDFFDQLLQ